jgi:hypothetical protein
VDKEGKLQPQAAAGVVRFAGEELDQQRDSADHTTPWRYVTAVAGRHIPPQLGSIAAAF